MDKIRLQISEIDTLEKTSYKSYEVEIFLNEKTLGSSLFNAAEVLSAVKFDFTEFDLFTCSCGVPGCAGYHSPVTQQKTKNIVKWTFPSENYYSTEKLIYEFNRKEFELIFKSLTKRMIELENDNVHHYSLLRDESSYVGFDEEKGEESYSLKDSLKKSVKWYDRRFKSEENFNILLNSVAPDLMNKSFVIEYDGVKGENGYTLHSVICRSMNQFPQKVKEPFFWAKAKLTIKAVREALTGNNKLLVKIIHNANAKFDDNGFHLVSYDFHGKLTEENFDLTKLRYVIKE